MQQATPLVSVVMPAYNAEPFIAEAILSVLAQTVTNLELIIIDDRSTDRTRQIIEEFAETDLRICSVHNEENLGVAKTRNRGISLCRGKYIALLDSDDYWKPQFLEKMIVRAEETGADIVYCSYELVDEQGKKLCRDFIVPPETTFEQYIVRSVITCTTVMFTAELAKNNPFPTNIYHEDTALCFRLLRDGYIARGVTEILAAYRQRAKSRSSDKLICAIRRWPIYRKHLNMSVGKTISTMVRYGYYGLKKYKKVTPAGGERKNV